MNAMKREFKFGQSHFIRDLDGEHSTLIFVFNGFRLKKSTLVGRNRDAHKIETTCKSYWKFELKCE